MRGHDLRGWLKHLRLRVGDEGGEWIHVSCPLAPWTHKGMDSSPSMGFQVMPGESRVYCMGCGFGSTQTGLLMELWMRGARGIDYSAAIRQLSEMEEQYPMGLPPGDYEDNFAGPAELHEFPDWLLSAFEPAYHDSTVHPYLEERECPIEVAEFLDLRWDHFRYRVIFPVRDWEGRLMGLHGRHIGGGYAPGDVPKPYRMYPHEKHTNSQVWLGEHFVDTEQPVVVAESVFDLARVLEVYPNVMSPLTAGMGARKLTRLEGIERIITIFDADMAGDQARAKLTNGTQAEVSHIVLPPGRDAGDMTPRELDEVLTEHLS